MKNLVVNTTNTTNNATAVNTMAAINNGLQKVLDFLDKKLFECLKNNNHF